MTTAAVIAEYNPFHNGHFYQLQEIRRQTGADYILVVMSGDFVQRGEPALFDKYTRTRMALNSGADLVFELPTAFATSSAQDFADGAIALLNRLGVVDLLCFGSESGDLAALTQAAQWLASEPPDASGQIRAFLRQGMTYPAARSASLSSAPEAASAEGADDTRHPAQLLTEPNNILAAAYLNALRASGSKIQPYTIKRIGQGYHDTIDPQATGQAYASASAVRSGLSSLLRECQGHAPAERIRDFLGRCLPSAAMAALETEGAISAPVSPDDLSVLLNAEILRLKREEIPFCLFADVSPELANRLQRHALSFDSFTGRIRQLKTKQLTYTRVSRALLHLLLGVTADSIREYKAGGLMFYARLLGFRRSASPLLTAIRRRSSLPLLTRIAGAEGSLCPTGAAMLRQEQFASHLYQSLAFQKGRVMKNEYTKSVIVIP